MPLTQVPQQMLTTGATPVGVSQTWQNVVASRAKRTTYQNTSGRPIVVSVSFYCAFGSTLELWVGAASDVTTSGVMVSKADGGDYYSPSAYTNHFVCVQAIIPTGHYYQAYDPDNNVSIQNWAELS